MNNVHTPPKSIIVLTLITIIGTFGLAITAFVLKIETAPIILAVAFVGSAAVIYMFHFNALSMEISNLDVVIFKGKKEVARYTRSMYDFEIIKQRYPGKKSPIIYFVASNQEGKTEHDISILGLKGFKAVANDLGIEHPDLIGYNIVK